MFPLKVFKKNNVSFIYRILLFSIVVVLVTACSVAQEYIPANIQRTLAEADLVIRIVFGLIGFALLVAGFSMYEFLLQIIGFLIGGSIGGVIGLYIGNNANIGWIGAVIGFISLGIVGAWLAMFMTYIAIFISGAAGGITLFSGISTALMRNVPESWYYMIGAVLGGIVLVVLFRFWISALTSAMGATMLGASLAIPPEWWIALFLIGLAVQFGVAKLMGKEEQVKIGYQKPKKGSTSDSGMFNKDFK